MSDLVLWHGRIYDPLDNLMAPFVTHQTCNCCAGPVAYDPEASDE